MVNENFLKDELKAKILNEVIKINFPNLSDVEPKINQILSRKRILNKNDAYDKPSVKPAEFSFEFIKIQNGRTDMVMVTIDEEGIINKVIYSK